MMTIPNLSRKATVSVVLMMMMMMVFTTVAVTATGSNHRHHHSHGKRHARAADFVKAMDRVMGKTGNINNNERTRNERHETFLSRLRAIATPASSIPGFYDDYDFDENNNNNNNANNVGGMGDNFFESDFVQDVVLESSDPNGRRYLEEWSGYAVNLTEYALKYVGCSNIKTWSDELAENGGNNNINNNGNDDGNAGYNSNTVLKTERFVVLRLCPRDECSNYNKYGCMERYGDYVIPMDIYLQIMAETFFAQYQEYCQTCYECMAAFNNNNNANGGNNNANNANNYNDDANAQKQQQQNYNDDGYNNNNNGNGNNNNGNRRRRRRRLDQQYDDAYYNNNNNNNNYDDDANNANYNQQYNDDANNNANANDDAAAAGGDDFYNYYQNNANQNGGCEYYAVCENYESACDDYSYLASDLEQYFGCAEFYIGNNAGYLGPHCKSDGKTIALGIFHDENCYNYNADLNEMSNYMDVSDNDLEVYYSNNCISCLASDGYTLEVDNNGDGYSDVSDICGALYDESAKCNKYMGNAGDYSSENQEGTEDAVCGFIHNLITNSYDEYGEIYLQGSSWTEYIPHMEDMAQWQKYFLSTMVLGCVILFFTACYLHRQITQRKFVWYPRGRRGYSSNDPMLPPQRLSERGNSGIIQGRSQSSSFELKDGGVMS